MISNQLLRAVLASIRADVRFVMLRVMRIERPSRPWWRDVAPVDRRPLVAGLVADGRLRRW